MKEEKQTHNDHYWRFWSDVNYAIDVLSVNLLEKGPGPGFRKDFNETLAALIEQHLEFKTE